MNYHIIISEKQNELIKAIKTAIGLAFQKGQISPYQIDLCMFNGTFMGEIKDWKNDKTLCEISSLEIYPRCSMDIDKIVSDYDVNIKHVKEFTAILKKLK